MVAAKSLVSFPRTLFLGLILVSPFGRASAQGGSAALRDSIARVGGRVIVTLRQRGGGAALLAPGAPVISETEIDRISGRFSSNYSVQEVARAPYLGMMVATVSPDKLAALLADSNVAAVEPDRLWAPTDLGGATLAADPWNAYKHPNSAARADSMLYGITSVAAPQAWALGYKGDGVRVGVLDSGGDGTHPDLNYAGGYDAVHGDAVNWSDDVLPCLGHGTHVAGTIAAKDDGVGVVGVAPHVQLYAIKIFENINGSCLAYTSSEIAGLNWAVSQHINLVNMSLGGTYSSALEAGMQWANSQGTYTIAAAGNNGSFVTYPASSPYAIAIAAVDNVNSVQSWSSPGPEVDFAAPGSWIYSTTPITNGYLYGYKSGTSMATPHAVGVAALILQANPSFSFDQLRNKMIAGALDIASPGFDVNSGYGLLRAYNSITGGGTPPPVPLVLAVSPASRNASAQQGAAAPSDNAIITLTGDNSSSTAWTATKKKSWTTLTTASGTGSGTVGWSRSTAGLAVGTYVDTITVSASGAGGSPTSVIDTLRITAAPVPLLLAVSPAVRSTSVQQGGSAPSDNATITLTGDNSSTTAWSATRKKSWTTLTTASGTGSGTVAWSRSTVGLAVGTYVDTITVSAAGAGGSPTSVIDTLKITAAAVPLAIGVSPGARSVSVQVGTSAPPSNVAVTFTGDNASTATWSATKKKSWTTLTAASGTGNGSADWSRNATGLAVGTYVDTITITAPGALNSPVMVLDTLKITAAAVPLVLAVGPASRSANAQVGTAAPGDNATVTLTGDNSSTTGWTATRKKSWTTLTVASGTGSGTVSWSRSTSGLSVGTYVDTITVTAAGAGGSPTSVIDTLRITAAAVPLALGVSPGARSVSVQVGGIAPPSNVAVIFTGDNAGTATWSATKRKSWTTLTAPSGTGNGSADWSRNATGLGVGTYVDTITITAPGALYSPAMVLDTLKITAAPVPLVMAVSPASRNASAQQGTAAPGDNATITLSGDNAGTTTWSASKRKSWTVLTNSSGTGNGTMSWNRSTTGLAAGTYVDTITVTALGAGGSPTSVIDTLRITALPVPLAVAVSPGSRRVSVQAGTSAPATSATVSLTGDNASTATWSATKKKSWTTLTLASGTGSGSVTWSRNASGLSAGTYVDTISVIAAGANGSPATVIDTLLITATPVPLVVAVSPASRHVSVTQGTSVPGDNATVTLTGGGASSATWSASKRKSWTTLSVASGTGSGTVSWQRNATGLAAGTYVDTITVLASGAVGSPVEVIDSLIIAAAPNAIDMRPKGKKSRVLTATGFAASLSSSGVDSALVEGDGSDPALARWMAVSMSPRLKVVTDGGDINTYVVWQRQPIDLTLGMHVDTLVVKLVSDPSVQAMFVDSLEVVSIAVPDPALAVEDLIGHGGLSADQRAVLDRSGNNNGEYDLGDFLAWVDHARLHLSPAVVSRLRTLTTAKTGSHGPESRPPQE